MDVYNLIIWIGLIVVACGCVALGMRSREKRPDGRKADGLRQIVPWHGDVLKMFGSHSMPQVNVDGTPMIPGAAVDAHGKAFGDFGRLP